MQAAVGPESSAYEITQQLACGQSGCRCHLAAKKGSGLTHCPVHADNAPSLNVTIKTGVLLIHCQATCEQSVVIAALAERGLWQKEPERAKREIIATYDYLDTRGNLLYQSVRFVPKGFAQRRPDGSGGWLWNLDSVERVLFGLPDLLSAAPNRLRFIVEGEKDVETLRRHGLVATCNVGGAGKWRDEYSRWFYDRDVVLIPDNDSAGRKHMLQVAENLKGIAHSIRWLDLPSLEEKGDTTDWLSINGHTMDAFKQLVKVAPFYGPEFSQQTPPVVTPLSDLTLERALIAWCFEVRETANYLKLDDFTDVGLRRLLEQFQAGEVIEDKPVGLPEADPGLDVYEVIRKIRDLSYRRNSIRIAECIVKAASATDSPFDPCIAADVLRAVCEVKADCAGVAPRLSECLDLT